MTNEELYDEYCVDNKARDQRPINRKPKRRLDLFKGRTKPRFKIGNYVLLKGDQKRILFSVYKVKESGYVIIGVRSGVILSNLIPENRLLRALPDIDYTTIVMNDHEA